MGRRCTEISVLDVAAGLALGFDDVVALFCHVLDKHLLFSISYCKDGRQNETNGCESDNERGVV